MKTILITLFFAVSACSAFGQTTLNGPVTISPPKGGSPTFILDLVPAAPNFPCIAAPAGYYAICGQSNAITVDFGDGKGFVSLKGGKGDTGLPGTNGINGANGKDGINGTNGLPATIALGNVTTLPAGAQAAVTTSGTAQNAVFSFGIPQGSQGIQGAPGAAWSPTGKTFSIKCAWGGHGVPQFNVMGCTITQQ